MSPPAFFSQNLKTQETTCNRWSQGFSFLLKVFLVYMLVVHFKDEVIRRRVGEWAVNSSVLMLVFGSILFGIIATTVRTQFYVKLRELVDADGVVLATGGRERFIIHSLSLELKMIILAGEAGTVVQVRPWEFIQKWRGWEERE